MNTSKQSCLYYKAVFFTTLNSTRYFYILNFLILKPWKSSDEFNFNILFYFSAISMSTTQYCANNKQLVTFILIQLFTIYKIIFFANYIIEKLLLRKILCRTSEILVGFNLDTSELEALTRVQVVQSTIFILMLFIRIIEVTL